MTSLIGELELERAYYHCRACRQGQVPWDASLAVGRRDLTPAAAEVTTLAGILGSFAQASQRVLGKMAGLRLSESTVERTTEEAGAAGRAAASEDSFRAAVRLALATRRPRAPLCVCQLGCDGCASTRSWRRPG